ncbi:MAG: helix-turn-helix domain-containing protein [Caulobacteraceae bacterium]
MRMTNSPFQSDVRAWVRGVIERKEITISEWAERSGVSRATIFRILNDKYEFMPSSRTLQKLTATAPENRSYYPEAARPKPCAGDDYSLTVRHALIPGAWALRNPNSAEDGRSNILPLDKNRSYVEWLTICMENTQDGVFRRYDLVHIMEVLGLFGHPLKVGDAVVLARQAMTGDSIGAEELSLRKVSSLSPPDMIELSFFDAERHGDGFLESGPPTWVMPSTGMVVDGIRYRIAGTVQALYRRFRPQSH